MGKVNAILSDIVDNWLLPAYQRHRRIVVFEVIMIFAVLTITRCTYVLS